LTATPTPSPSSTRTTAIIVVVIAFIAGLFAGIAGDRFYLIRAHRLFPSRRAGAFAERRIAQRLDHELNLTDQQQAQVQKILETHRGHIDTIMTGVRPQIRKELDAMNADIEKILTPDQRAQFAKMRMRMPRRGGPGGPPPAP